MRESVLLVASLLLAIFGFGLFFGTISLVLMQSFGLLHVGAKLKNALGPIFFAGATAITASTFFAIRNL